MIRKYLAITALGLLIQLARVGLGQMQSPCHNIFQYVRSESGEEIEGRIEIPNVPKGIALRIVLKLTVAVALPTKYVGKLELAKSRDLSVQAVQQGRPLIYRVRFPSQRPVPLITTILFNNQEYCSGRRAMGQIVTSITLEHTLFPPGVSPQSQNMSMDVAYSASKPKPTRPSYPITKSTATPSTKTTFTLNLIPPSTMDYAPEPIPNFVPMQEWNTLPVLMSTEPPTPVTSSLPVTEPASKPVAEDVPPRDFTNANTCGSPKKSSVNFLIAKGEKTEPGDWPWLVAIFVSRIKLEFQCAGSLVSNRHVVTAAHCLKGGDGQALPTNTLLAVVGRYRLRNWAERGSVTYEVSEFKVHAEYGRRGAGFDADLAVMTLMETITFGRLILPVCLWSGSLEIESVVGKTGFVVGWGRDEQGNSVTTEPRMTKVPIVSQEECLRSNADFVQITSNRTFCGGARDGSGPCNGDSGGGLVMYDPRNRRYHLRGIVSLSLLDRDTGACDLSQFVVYTDAAKYTDWIQQQIAT